MKVKVKYLAVCLAAASLFTLVGCKKTTPDNRVATTANWNVRTSVKVENNYNEYWQNHVEVATYSTEFTEGSNSSYTVSYKTAAATYVTRFYMESAYDWTASSIPENYRKDEGAEPVYVFETERTISGTFVLTATGDSHSFEDGTLTVCKFRQANDHLEPVYSKQIVKNTSPANLQASKIEGAFVTIDKTFETFYNKECSEATIRTTDNAGGGEAESRKVKISNGKGYSTFDNCQIAAAIRAFTLTGSSTRTFNTLIPQNGAVATVKATVGSATELKKDDLSQAGVINALNSAMPQDYIFFDGATEGDEATRTARYTPVTLSVGKGASPTYWYCTMENGDINTTRSLLLRYSTPLAFSTGTLAYTLKSVAVESK